MSEPKSVTMIASPELLAKSMHEWDPKAAAARIESLEAQLAGRKAVPVELLREARDALKPLAYTHVVVLRNVHPEFLLAQYAYPGLVVWHALKARDVLARLSAYLSEAQEGEGVSLGRRKTELAAAAFTARAEGRFDDAERLAREHNAASAPAEKAAGATPALPGQGEAACEHDWHDWSSAHVEKPFEVCEKCGLVKDCNGLRIGNSPEEFRAYVASHRRAAPPSTGEEG